VKAAPVAVVLRCWPAGIEVDTAGAASVGGALPNRYLAPDVCRVRTYLIWAAAERYLGRFSRWRRARPSIT
jgi:hypothetical protein